MRNDCETAEGRHPTRRARWQPGGALAVAFAGLALLGAACSDEPTGSGMASLGSTTTTSAPNGGSSASGEASALGYSRCMREHGVTNFPDPDAEGRLTIEAGVGTGLDPDSPTFQSAEEACGSLLPSQELSPAEQAEVREAGLKFSKCMREQGIENFPDPNAEGGISIDAGGGLDPESPEFKAAEDACEHILERLSGGGPRVDNRREAP